MNRIYLDIKFLHKRLFHVLHFISDDGRSIGLKKNLLSNKWFLEAYRRLKFPKRQCNIACKPAQHTAAIALQVYRRSNSV